MIDDAIEMMRRIRDSRKGSHYEIRYFSPRMQIDVLRSVVSAAFLISLVDEPAAARMISRLPKLTNAVMGRKWETIMRLLLEMQDELESSMKAIGISTEILYKD